MRSNLIFYPWNTPYFQALFITLTEWLQKHTATAATNALHFFFILFWCGKSNEKLNWGWFSLSNTPTSLLEWLFWLNYFTGRVNHPSFPEIRGKHTRSVCTATCIILRWVWNCIYLCLHRQKTWQTTKKNNKTVKACEGSEGSSTRRTIPESHNSFFSRKIVCTLSKHEHKLAIGAF